MHLVLQKILIPPKIKIIDQDVNFVYSTEKSSNGLFDMNNEINHFLWSILK